MRRGEILKLRWTDIDFDNDKINILGSHTKTERERDTPLSFRTKLALMNVRDQDHTWFRKNENAAGRWTSPDPYKGSMKLGDPQSFNRYSYVQNDPVNYVDPSGLQIISIGGAVYLCETTCTGVGGSQTCDETICRLIMSSGGGGGIITPVETGPPIGPVGPVGPENPPKTENEDCPPGPTQCLADKLYKDCVDNAWSKYREAHFSDGLKTVAGTAIVIAGVAYTILEVRHARSKGHIDRGAASHGVASVGLAVILAGGALLGDVFFSGRNEAATLKKKIADCKKKFPSADHSYEGRGIII